MLHSSWLRLTRHISLSLGSLIAFIILALPTSALSAELTVAVASNFKLTAAKLVQQFKQRYREENHRVPTIHLLANSSGKLYAQIHNGAPIDIFMSADEEKPRLLAEQGVVDAASIISYAVGQLVLVEHSKKKQHRIAIANPKHAPYGIAADQVLDTPEYQHLQPYQRITAENVMQALHYFQIGAVEAAIVARALIQELQQQDDWSIAIIQSNLHSAIVQNMALTHRGKSNALARDFYAFLQQPESKKLIESDGYLSPTDSNN